MLGRVVICKTHSTFQEFPKLIQAVCISIIKWNWLKAFLKILNIGFWTTTPRPPHAKTATFSSIRSRNLSPKLLGTIRHKTWIQMVKFSRFSVKTVLFPHLVPRHLLRQVMRLFHHQYSSHSISIWVARWEVMEGM